MALTTNDKLNQIYDLVHTLTASNKELAAANTELTSKVGYYQRFTTAKDTQINEMTVQLESLAVIKIQLEGYRDQCKQLQEDNAALQTQVTDLTTKLSESEARFAVTQNDKQIDEASKISSEVAYQTNLLDQQVSTLKDQLAAAQENNNKLTQQAQENQNTIATLQSNYQEARQTIDRLTNDINNLNKQISQYAASEEGSSEPEAQAPKTVDPNDIHVYRFGKSTEDVKADMLALIDEIGNQENTEGVYLIDLPKMKAACNIDPKRFDVLWQRLCQMRDKDGHYLIRGENNNVCHMEISEMKKYVTEEL